MYTNEIGYAFELNGKTIETCEIIPVESFRSAASYLLLTFKDNTRHAILIHNFNVHKPDPDAVHMAKAQFFSPAEIAEKEQRDEDAAEGQRRHRRAADMRAYLALKASLDIED